MIIDELKSKYNMTSEQLFDIQEPLEHQCSKITKYKDEYKAMFKELNNCTRYNYDNPKDLADDVSSAIWGLDEDYFEEIRTAIEEVRVWGQEWKDLCKKIINENPELIKRYVYEEME